MRSIECIIRDCPHLTGTQILAVQEQERLADKKAEDRRNKKKIAFMNDINKNGGYYKSRFGFDQHTFYKITNMQIDSAGNLMMDVEKIVLFCNNDGHQNTVCRPNEIRLEREKKEYQKEDQYCLDNRERVTKKEWDAINQYLDAMSQLFWGDIKMV